MGKQAGLKNSAKNLATKKKRPDYWHKKWAGIMMRSAAILKRNDVHSLALLYEAYALAAAAFQSVFNQPNCDTEEMLILSEWCEALEGGMADVCERLKSIEIEPGEDAGIDAVERAAILLQDEAKCGDPAAITELAVRLAHEPLAPIAQR